MPYASDGRSEDQGCAKTAQQTEDDKEMPVALETKEERNNDNCK